MLTNEQWLSKVMIDLYRQPVTRWFSFVLQSLRHNRNDDVCDTICITEDGNIYWNDKFISEQTCDEKNCENNLKFLNVHELKHIIDLTFPRKGKRNHGKWNIATDLAINWSLIRDGFTFTPNAKWSQPWNKLVPDKSGIYIIPAKEAGTKKDIKLNLENMCAEEIYDSLPDKMGEGEGEGDGEGKGSGNGKSGSGKRGKGGFDEHHESDECKKNPAERERQARRMKKVVIDAIMAQKMQGNGTAEMERILGRITKVELPWQNLLNRYITQDIMSDYTWMKPSKRFIVTKVYTPSVLKENIDVHIAIDTSGSIAIDEYSKFMSECLGMLQVFSQVKIHILYWADGIDPKDNIDVEKAQKDKLLKHYPKNTGGTNISCVKKYLEDKRIRPQVVIYFTDGHVENNPKLFQNNIVVISKGGSDSILKKYSKKLVNLRGE